MEYIISTVSSGKSDLMRNVTMAMRYCPGCMKFLPETDKCFFCGYSSKESTPAKTALPPETELNGYLFGAMLASNRQAQFYCALDKASETPVIIEEFFPYMAAGRRPDSSEVVNVLEKEAFEEARALFLASTAERKLKLLTAFEANNTAYRVYALSALTPPSAQCEEMVQEPVFFRDATGQPLMTINSLAIPPMPAQRGHRKNPHARSLGRVIAIILAVLLLAAGTAAALFMTGVLPGVPALFATPEPTVQVTSTPAPATEAPTAEPTEVPTPEPTAVPEIRAISALAVADDAMTSEGYLVIRESYTITGNAEPGAAIMYTLNDTENSLAADKDGSFSFEIQPAMLVTDQPNVLTLTSVADQRSGIASANLTFLYKPEMSPVTLAADPAEGEQILSGSVENDAQVTLLVNDEEVSAVRCDHAGAFAFPAVELAAGDKVSLRASDAAGNSTLIEYDIPFRPITIAFSDATPNEAGYLPTQDKYLLEGNASNTAELSVYLNEEFYRDLTCYRDGVFFLELPADALSSGETNTLVIHYSDRPDIASEPLTFSYKSEISSLAVDGELREGLRDIQGNAEDGSIVRLTIDQVQRGEQTAADGRFRFANISLTQGQSVELSATDAAGNEKNCEITVLSRGLLTIDPRSFVSNKMGGEAITITGTAEGGKDLWFHVTQSGGADRIIEAQPEIDSSGKWTAGIDASALEHGQSYVFFIAFRDEPEIDSRSMLFKTDLVCDLSFQPPVSGDENTSLAGTAPESTQVSLYIQDELIAETAVESDGSFTMTFPSYNMDQQGELRATDALGNNARLPVTIPERPLRPVQATLSAELITSGNLPLVVTGTSNAGKTLIISVDDVEMASITADEQGAWTASLSGAPLTDTGAHTISVVYSAASEEDSGETAAICSVVSDTVCEQIQAPGFVYADETALRGTAEAGAQVSLHAGSGELLAQTAAQEDGSFAFSGLNLTDIQALRLTATDSHDNPGEPVDVAVKPARALYSGGLYAAAPEAPVQLTAEAPAYTLNCEAWFAGAADLTPTLSLLDSNGASVAQLTMVQLFSEERDALILEQKLDLEKQLAQSCWKTDPTSLTMPLSSAGSYRLCLSVLLPGDTEPTIIKEAAWELLPPKEESQDVPAEPAASPEASAPPAETEPKASAPAQPWHEYVRVMIIPDELTGAWADSAASSEEEAPVISRAETPYLIFPEGTDMQCLSQSDLTVCLNEKLVSIPNGEQVSFSVTLRENVISAEGDALPAGPIELREARLDESGNVLMTVVWNGELRTVRLADCNLWEVL